MLSFAGKNGEGVVINESIGPWRKNIRSWKCLFRFFRYIYFVPVATQTLKMTGRVFSYLFNVGEVIGYG